MCILFLGDYFAVRVTEDPVYATPIFTTMGGQSKCPGESMTSRRESNVRIMSIEHRCGYGGDEICDFRTLGDNGVAYFAAIIYNDSPTNEPVDYTIGLANSFSEYGTTCGTRGKITGLQVDFDQTDLGDIPYRKQIEVPFRVRRNSVYHCHNYVDVEVAITATCEEASSSSYVYQYGLVSNSAGVKEISYDTANVMNEATSSATFSLSWAIVSRPSNAPTFAPTASPSQTPSFGPTISPTLSQNPTQVPTTLSPTPTPTTTSPSQIPTRNPTRIPTRNPTKSPSTGVRRQLGEVNMEEDERDSLRNQVDELTKKMDSVLNALNLMSEETKKSK